jgi:hypothetical protein
VVRLGAVGIRLFAALCSAVALLGQAPAQAGTAAPRPLVVLWELGGGLDAGPYPQGLRFALFDDGQVIGTIQAGETFGAGDYVAARMAPQQAQRFAAALLAPMRAMPVRGDGTSYLRVWDAAAQTFRATSAGAFTHCGAESSPLSDLDRSLGFKADFFTLCDSLIDYLRRRASPWHPRALWVLLRRQDEAPSDAALVSEVAPDTNIRFAGLSGAYAADASDTGEPGTVLRAACLPLAGAFEPAAAMVQGFTFLDGKPPAAADPIGRPVRADLPGAWTIVAAEYALPADLQLADGATVAHGCPPVSLSPP